MSSTTHLARAWCALLVCFTVLLIAPAHGSAMNLMTEDQDTLNASLTPPHNWGTPYRAMATERAGWLGASYLRGLVLNQRGFSWDRSDAFVNNAVANDFKPFLTVGYQPYDREVAPADDPSYPIPTASDVAGFCTQVASRYGDRVNDYSVFNEPNYFKWRIASGSTTATPIPAATYGDFFRNCAAAIRSVDPGANVYFGELAAGAASCSYVTAALSSATVTVADGLAFHPYQEGTAPWDAAPARCSGISSLADWESVATTAAASSTAAKLRTPAGTRVPLLVTEFGYCNIGKDCTGNPADYLDDARKATWLAAAYRRALDSGVTFFSYYHLVSFPELRPWDSGIVDMAGNMSLAARALRAATGVQDPTATATAASDVSPSTATLNGEVRPNGSKLTYWFEYGTTTAYGQSTPAREIGAGAGGVSVSAQLTGLRANTRYHVRLVAQTRAGKSEALSEFTTALMPKPATVKMPNGDRYIFYRGLDGQLKGWYWNGSVWRQEGWGSTGRVAGDPTAAVTTAGIAEVFYRTSDGAMGRWRIAPGFYQHDENGAPGIVTGEPTAVADRAGGVQVFYRTNADQLGRWWFNGARWNHTIWGRGGTVAGNPSAVLSADDTFEVFYRTPTAQMGRWRFAGAGSENDVYGVGNMTGRPSAVATGGGNVEVFVRTDIGQLGRWWFNGAGWNYTGWGDPDDVAGSPSAVVMPSGRIEIAYRNASDQAGRWWFLGDDWHQSAAGSAGALAGEPTLLALTGVVSVFFGSPTTDYVDFSYDEAGPGRSWTVLR